MARTTKIDNAIQNTKDQITAIDNQVMILNAKSETLKSQLEMMEAERNGTSSDD